MKKGKFIVFEGIDGAGTTTQSKMLVEKLKEDDYDVILTFEPSDNPIGKVIRQALQKEITLDEKSMAILFAADRAEHLKKTVIPALEAGKIVVCDRYFLSTLAYQSVYEKKEYIQEINSFIIAPDITLLIDIDPAISLQRKANLKAEHYEKYDFQIAVREKYLEFADEYRRKHNVRVINGKVDIEKLSNDIYKMILVHL